MSTNSRTRKVYYKPKMDQYTAYEQLPDQVRLVLQTSLADWDAYAVLRYCRKFGWAAALLWVEKGNAAEARRPWQRGDKGNPCLDTGVKPLRL